MDGQYHAGKDPEAGRYVCVKREKEKPGEHFTLKIVWGSKASLEGLLFASSQVHCSTNVLYDPADLLLSLLSWSVKWR